MRTGKTMKMTWQKRQTLRLRQMRFKRRAHGSTLVEFALILPILLAMLIGIMEFGILTNYKLRISNAAREGARYASLGRSKATVVSRIQLYTAPLTVSSSEVVLNSAGKDEDPVTFDTAVTDSGDKNTVTPGDLIQVAVNTPHRPLTKFFPFLTGYRLRATVVMRRE